VQASTWNTDKAILCDENEPIYGMAARIIIHGQVTSSRRNFPASKDTTIKIGTTRHAWAELLAFF